MLRLASTTVQPVAGSDWACCRALAIQRGLACCQSSKVETGDAGGNLRPKGMGGRRGGGSERVGGVPCSVRGGGGACVVLIGDPPALPVPCCGRVVWSGCSSRAAAARRGGRGQTRRESVRAAHRGARGACWP